MKLRKILPFLHGYIVWPEPNSNRAEPGPNWIKPSKMHQYSTVPYRTGVVQGFLSCPGFRTFFLWLNRTVLGQYGSVRPELGNSRWFRKPWNEPSFETNTQSTSGTNTQSTSIHVQCHMSFFFATWIIDFALLVHSNEYLDISLKFIATSTYK